ncbi:MAG: hypothetical protein L3J46_11815, partial [Kangiellaceae bacterium]|nr:hypothetical protein [Kangiellaceae bacterium]
NTYLGSAIAITPTLVPVQMRAFSSAMFFLVLNLIGLGFGPLYVGFISDLLEPTLKEESLRWALAATFPISLIAIGLFFAASKQLAKDLD